MRNKFNSLLKESLNQTREQTNNFGYVKSYPKENIIAGEIIFTLPFNAGEGNAYYTASPLDPNCYTLPIVGQMVLILYLNNNFYYCGYFQFTKQQNADFLLQYISEQYCDVSGSAEEFKNVSSKIFPVDTKVPEINKFVGETFISGNCNNNVVLGYDANGEAKLSIIQNRFDSTYDLNTPGIHMRTNQKITDEIEYPNSTDIEDNESNFLLLTEDILNLVSKVGNVIITSNDKIIINAKDIIYLNADKDIVIDGKSVKIGKDADEPLVLGNKLIDTLDDIISSLDNVYSHLTTVYTPLNALASGGLTANMTAVTNQQIQLVTLKNKLKKQILSKNHKTI